MKTNNCITASLSVVLAAILVLPPTGCTGAAESPAATPQASTPAEKPPPSPGPTSDVLPVEEIDEPGAVPRPKSDVQTAEKAEAPPASTAAKAEEDENAAAPESPSSTPPPNEEKDAEKAAAVSPPESSAKADEKVEEPPTPPPSVTTTQPAEEEGFITTDSGLKYKDIKVGEGPTPEPTDLLKVRYTATLADGTEFASSPDDGSPHLFRIGMKPRPRAIRGWEEGASTMKVGGKRTLIVPPELGYGPRGRPPKIPANATLRYEIELVDIERAPKMTETQPTDEAITETGLRYVDLKAGEGDSPTVSSIVKVRAATWDADGGLVDTSSEREDPASVIIGTINHPMVKDGLMGMKVGGKRKLFVGQPPRGGTEQSVEPPPVQAIIEVELLEVIELPLTDTPEESYTVTTSGLKYHDIKVGEGESPTESARVKVHYTGWLEDGTVFDSTAKSGEAMEFSLSGGVIKGWMEGMTTMKVGGKRKLVIPPDLGYGARGRRSIPPNAILTFEVELLEIVQP